MITASIDPTTRGSVYVISKSDERRADSATFRNRPFTRDRNRMITAWIDPTTRGSVYERSDLDERRAGPPTLRNRPFT
jgi:hypothetical protein